MAIITPCRTQVSDRFPVASFVVRVPSDRCFEVACATKPELLRAGAQRERTERNFFTTRLGGLLRAPGGEATILIPPDQLKRFAGAQRVYYALGSYADADGTDARFSVSPGEPERAPFIRLASDFTGRALDYAGSSNGHTYGRRRRAPLVWGGDLGASRRGSSSQPHAPVPYDDGYDPSLWSRAASSPSFDPPPPPPPSARVGHRGGPDSYSDDYYGSYPEADDASVGMSASTMSSDPASEPPGYEDPSAMSPSSTSAYGHNTVGGYGGLAPSTEPAGFEDAVTLGRSGQARAVSSTSVAHHYGSAIGGAASSHDAEPPGAGDVAALPGGSTADPVRLGGHNLGANADAGASGFAAIEPEGFEDGAHLYGSQGHGVEPAEASRTTADAPSYGRPAKKAVTLTLQEKGKIVRPAFRLRGGLAAYGRVARDSNRGLTWGVGEFNAADGTLAEVLAKAWPRDRKRRADERVFGRAFRGRFDELSQRFGSGEPPDSSAFAQALASRDDWDESFALAGTLHEADPAVPPDRDPIKLAQNEVTITRHLDPALAVARRLDLRDDRSLAMMYDMAVSHGLSTTESWFERAVAGAPSEPDARTEHVVQYAERHHEPWAGRMRELVSSHDLHGTVYDLSAYA